jgi:hypothetical protein
MSSVKVLTLTVVIIISGAAALLAENEGRIYGKVYTEDGDVLEGLIRWDRNEASWIDILDGTKELPEDYDREARTERDRYREKRKKVELFGLEIYSESGDYYTKAAQSGLRFGHIKMLKVMDDNTALLRLKSGQEVKLSGGSTDLGSNIREIIIEDRREGEWELLWDDIDSIVFMQARPDLSSNFGDRLYGTLVTRGGDSFTGWVCWDVDEVFTLDILDGEEDGRSRKIKFDKISSIERYSSSGATVILKSGDELVLKGTNDVNDDNRGILISDPSFGQVTVDWDEFERIDFKQPSRQITYDDIPVSRELYGTVYRENGDKYTGKIRWDNDEEYTWELLDGRYRDMDFDIEFGLIDKLEKRRRGSIVTTKDGREFRLEDSNDVDEDNKGIFVTTDDGDQVVIDWDEFDRVDFK